MTTRHRFDKIAIINQLIIKNPRKNLNKDEILFTRFETDWSKTKD